MSRVRRAIAAALVLSAYGSAGVTASEPLYVKNLSPVAGLLGLPSQRDARTTASGGVAVALHSSIASHYISDSSTSEFLNLDGETLRFALDMRYGLAENWDLQLEVPWLDHSGGDLDGLIDDWHDLWGMSDGGRSDVPNDLLDYRYVTTEGGFGLQDNASGMGDITLSMNYAFYRDDKAAASVSLGYKFGTGDEDDFTGSGTDDVFLALRLSGDHLSDLPLSWHGQVGYLRAGDSDLLDNYQEKNLWFAGVAMDWQFASKWSILLQLDSHAAPLDSNITGVGNDAYMATIGLRRRFVGNWVLDFSVIEDIAVETAPDVTFQASLAYRPGAGN